MSQGPPPPDFSQFERLRDPCVCFRSLLTGAVKVSHAVAGKTPRVADDQKLAVVVGILVRSFKHPSLHLPNISEWKADNANLGLLILIWIAGLVFECLLVMLVRFSWGWRLGLDSVKVASLWVSPSTFAPRGTDALSACTGSLNFLGSSGQSPAAFTHSGQFTPVGFLRHIYGGSLFQSCSWTSTYIPHCSW